MRPYYEEAGVTIYHGDCREVATGLGDGSMDLIVTDPPYGVRWSSGLRMLAFDDIANDDGCLDVPHVLDEMLRVLRNCRHAYIFGRFDWAGTRIRQAVELIWDKGQIGPGDLSLPWGPQHEVITFGVYVQSDKNTRDNYGRLSARLRRGSVLRVPRYNATAVDLHPTEKPVDLLRQLIESSSILGDVVFDPFAGVGSTLVAARMEGRTAIGIEIDERYCEIAAERLRQGVLPIELPSEPPSGRSLWEESA
jgi:site-specific DNA-methyltransferase (adenine-specific)